jgi:hypothetical protein
MLFLLLHQLSRFVGEGCNLRFVLPRLDGHGDIRLLALSAFYAVYARS